MYTKSLIYICKFLNLLYTYVIVFKIISDTLPYILKNINVWCTIGIITVQVGVYHEIVYSASLFNRLNSLGFASGSNILNNSAS